MIGGLLHTCCHFYSKTCFSVGSYNGSDPLYYSLTDILVSQMVSTHEIFQQNVVPISFFPFSATCPSFIIMKWDFYVITSFIPTMIPWYIWPLGINSFSIKNHSTYNAASHLRRPESSITQLQTCIFHLISTLNIFFTINSDLKLTHRPAGPDMPP